MRWQVFMVVSYYYVMFSFSHFFLGWLITLLVHYYFFYINTINAFIFVECRAFLMAASRPYLQSRLYSNSRVIYIFWETMSYPLSFWSIVLNSDIFSCFWIEPFYWNLQWFQYNDFQILWVVLAFILFMHLLSLEHIGTLDYQMK